MWCGVVLRVVFGVLLHGVRSVVCVMEYAVCVERIILYGVVRGVWCVVCCVVVSMADDGRGATHSICAHESMQRQEYAGSARPSRLTRHMHFQQLVQA